MGRKFDYIDPEKQREVYALARQFMGDFAWGHG
jgi:hypothetical protein